MSIEKVTHWALLIALLLGAFALRVHYLAHDRFHADEALYAGWALRILDDDPLLLDEPVDKPPLYLYLLAASMRLFGTSEVAARWPNMAASMINVALLYRLARRLYDRSTGRWAALFLACSPYAVLFARTAFTDPLLVTWTLAALNLIATGRPSSPPLGRTYRSGWEARPEFSYRPPLALRPGGGRTQAPPPLGEVGWGLCAGLALATKQHALLLLPLILGLAWVVRTPSARRPRPALRSILLALLGFALPYALVTWWDAQRWAIRPSFWQQGAQSYGGLHLASLGEWGSRLLEWLGWARYLAGSPVLYLLLGLGSVALLVRGWWRGLERQARMPALHDLGNVALPVRSGRQVATLGLVERASPQIPARVLPAFPLTPAISLTPAAPSAARTDPLAQGARLDWLWIGYGVTYLLVHAILGFSIWDRYLLPLAPLASIVLARIVVTGHSALSGTACRGASRGAPTQLRLLSRRLSLPRQVATAWAIVLCLAALFSGVRAARNGYPVGGEHWAYQGLEEIVAYLKTHAPPDAVLYHHWLRWHYTYYLHDTTIELRYWQSGEHLLREVARTPERMQYIVLPDWEICGLVLEGVVLKPLHEAYREDGTISLRLYQVSAASP
jgi:4-amino-4-deoxy-L-arabinose transferase-like glycosyltransferase